MDAIVAGADTLMSALKHHDKRSDERASEIISTIKECTTMSGVQDEVKVSNHFGGGGDNTAALVAAMAAGNRNMPVGDGLFGGGGVGALLALALLGRRGFGDGDGAGVVGTNAALQSGIEGIQHNINNLGVGINANLESLLTALTTQNIQSTLGEIQGAIPLAACQTQNAISAAAADINTQTLNQTLALQRDIGTLGTANALGLQGVQSSIAASTQSNLLATKDTQIAIERAGWATTQAINCDGDKTRALLVRQYEDTLNRQLTDVKNEVIELRGDRDHDRRSRELEISVNQNVNQTQAQAQQQQLLAGIATSLQALVQQNQVIHNGIVNLGTMTASGNPTSANTRVM